MSELSTAAADYYRNPSPETYRRWKAALLRSEGKPVPPEFAEAPQPEPPTSLEGVLAWSLEHSAPDPIEERHEKPEPPERRAVEHEIAARLGADPSSVFYRGRS